MTHEKSQGTALVTGGAKRMGRSLCITLATRGYNIALHYHSSKKEAEKTCAMINPLGVACELFACDLSNETETACLIYDVKKRFNDLNLLINNASIFKKSNFKRSPIGSLNQHFAINLKAPFILSKDFAMLCDQGHIINMLDASLEKNQKKYFAYTLSKKALYDLTQRSARELAPKIRVNGIAPGFILPPENAKKDFLNQRLKSIPLRKQGELLQITHSLEFLLDNRYLTGQIIYNDGGEHLWPSYA